MTTSTHHFVDQVFSSNLPQSRPAGSWQEFTVNSVDLRRLKLNLGPFVPFLTKGGEEGPGGIDFNSVLRQLVRYSREQAENSPTIFLTEAKAPADLLDRLELRQHSIAILDGQAMGSFVSGREHSQRYQTLGCALARCIGPSALSPYVPGKPASGGRFFGRTKTLDQVVSGKVIRNCTIVGNRRIGKTSLLYEVRDRLSQVYIPGKSIRFAEVYASKCKTTWDMVYLILSQFGVSTPKNISKFGAIAPRYVKRFPQLLREFARRNETQLVIFIDEFDSFLELDAQQNWEFLHLLREAAADDANCAVIIAGFRLLMQTRVRQDSPYYNFTREIALTPLNKEETLEMVHLPLSRMGIDIWNTNLPTMIHRETRGQPEMIQMYCQAVISFYEKRGVAPSDTELLKHVNRDPAFNRTILHTFLNNTNPWEQALCLQLMRRAASSDQGVAQFEFRVSDAEDVLNQLKISLSNSEMATLLNNLVVGSVIERVSGAPGQYHFAVPQLVRFCQEIDIDHLTEKALAKVRQQPLTIERLTLEPTEAAETFAKEA